MKIEQFEANRPEFNFEEFFDGKIRGWGQIYSFGSLQKQFVVDINCYREGDLIVLDEQFEFSDGRKVNRAWKIKRTGPRNYQAEADDVDGTGVGTTAGDAINFKYTLSMEKFTGSSLTVSADDWLFRRSETIVFNRLEMRKLGVKVGETLLVMEKQRK